ncbi:MAG: hypothetical protein ACI4LH_06195 [Candidatus Heritagella sp.]
MIKISRLPAFFERKFSAKARFAAASPLHSVFSALPGWAPGGFFSPASINSPFAFFPIFSGKALEIPWPVKKGRREYGGGRQGFMKDLLLYPGYFAIINRIIGFFHEEKEWWR